MTAAIGCIALKSRGRRGNDGLDEGRTCRLFYKIFVIDQFDFTAPLPVLTSDKGLHLIAGR
jgi:hypothetical protein